MAYQSSRSRLANLLIKATYNATKVLKAIKYPYVENVQFLHEAISKSHTELETNDGEIRKSPATKFLLVTDSEYTALPEYSKLRGYASHFNEGTPFLSGYVVAHIGYKNKYPKEYVENTTIDFGAEQTGNETGHRLGVQETELPLPFGGWEKIELTQ